MAINLQKLELLWKRLTDAKLQLDFAHSYINEINADNLSGDIPRPDGFYAYKNALEGEENAVRRYLNALQDFKAALALEQVPNGVSDDTATADGIGITPREREVLALIASGKTSKEIAAELGISFRTAVCHRYKIYQKLNVHSNVELVRVAMRMGLVEV